MTARSGSWPGVWMTRSEPMDCPFVTVRAAVTGCQCSSGKWSIARPSAPDLPWGETRPAAS
ncbi:hypothetical protein [Streptomyces sp. NPDC001601]|uniref:hypothetical protein n=1 Tax=unclassified Streptomyces TaxID=2593676 RepID=UPI0036AE966D